MRQAGPCCPSHESALGDVFNGFRVWGFRVQGLGVLML